MSAEGALPAAAAQGGIAAIAPGRRIALVIAALVCASACTAAPAPHLVATRTAPDGNSVASVRLAACGSAWCESLWIGSEGEEGTRLATLTGTERATEVVWAPGGSRVAIVVNGHQLRVYDVATRAPAGQLDLVPADGPPTTRIARGITFSDNGAAITFDDCPRDRSGCRPGIAAMRY